MTIKIPIVSEFDKKGIRSAEQTLNQFGKNVGIAFAAVAAATVAAGAVVADFAAKSISAAENVRQADDRLKQVATSMGIFGAQTDAVSQRLINFAESNEIVLATDAELIKSAQAKLLTFKQVADSADKTGGAFDRATMAALDLAAAGFGSAESNATQLGKALQDPIKGLTALTRSGVTFTAQEKENIKTLVQSGQTLKAQDLILKAIETQVGGTAAATAKASDKMKLAFENIYEQVGEALLPVFDEFVTVITDLTPQIGDALTPIAQHLAEVFKNQVLPAIQNFTKWLASPQGIQTVKDLTQAVIDGIGKFIAFGKAVFDNWDKITQAITVIGGLIIAVKTLTTVVEVAKAVQLLWNASIIASPLGILITVLGLAAVAVVAFTKDVNAETQALKKATNETMALEQEQNQLAEKIKQGGIEVNQYKNQLIKVNDKLMLVKTGFSTSAGEANRFNKIKTDGVNSQIDKTALKLQHLFNKFGETTAEARRFAALKPEEVVTEVETPSGPTAAEKAAEAFKKVQKLIKDTRKKVQEAQTDYRQAVNKAEFEYLSNESKIREEYTQKLLDIVNDSKNRIRDAFRGVASFTVQSFLSEFKQVEAARLKAFEDAKKAAEDAGSIFTAAFVKGDPVDAYLKGLRAKVAENAKILQVSGKLVEAGFSQTFIEQIIATGQEGGLSLAEGLLSANPEIIAEVKALYNDIERVSETGADALANTLYEKQGLATSELVKLYESTQQQLLDALEENHLDYTTALDDAAQALKESIADITTDFNESIAEMEGELGGLESAVKQFRNFLKGVVEETTAATSRNAIGASGKTMAGGGFVFNIDEALGQAPGTYAGSIANQPQTVINVNVQTDASQSVAMVGKSIGNTITKYVSTGGQVRVVSGSVAV